MGSDPSSSIPMDSTWQLGTEPATSSELFCCHDNKRCASFGSGIPESMEREMEWNEME